MKILKVISIITILTIILPCCNFNEDENSEVTNRANTYLTSLNKYFEQVNQSGFSSSASTRSNDNTNRDEAIYIELPKDTPKEIIELLPLISSFEDLYMLHDMTAAEIKLHHSNSEAGYQVNVSGEEVKRSLTPVVKESKTFIESLGFTEAEITQMVKENKGTEYDLVCLAIIIASNEMDHSENLSSIRKCANPFISTCLANSLGTDITNCALDALGVNILTGLGQSTAKAWTKAAITKAFKTVASKFLGPIGVAITLISFTICMHQKGYSCIYLKKVPTSPFINNCKIVYENKDCKQEELIEKKPENTSFLNK